MDIINKDEGLISIEKIMSPKEVKERYIISKEINDKISSYIEQIKKILDREDNRLIIVVGPCSLTDTEDALIFCERLKKLSEEVDDKILLIMRAFFEKPRTTLGWKGLLYDPLLDKSYMIEEGIKTTRKLLIEMSKIGVPLGTEFISSHVPKYIGDLISWAAIGARTSESQSHREFSSRLRMPVGFKNSVAGDIDVAVNGVITASSQHSYLSASDEGIFTKVKTKGNKHCHVLLRGGNKPNFDSDSIKKVQDKLKNNGLIENIMVDCGVGNSHKNRERQIEVFREVIKQRTEGNNNIIGIMLESHLNPENIKFDHIEYGISKIDGCVSWDESEKLIREAYSIL